jgi:uncharacterized metal-binding protein YceD (DUF177 family)
MNAKKRPSGSGNDVIRAAIAPEFARPLDLSSLRDEGIEREIEADAAERAALAKRFDLVVIEALTARVQVLPIHGQAGVGARISGRFTARVVQTCVVTLEPFDAEVSDAFELDLLPAAALEATDEAEVYGADEVEPLDGEELDLGELVAQYLSLALDPYPRRPNASLQSIAGTAPGTGGDPAAGPFAALGELRRKM